jgi:hypothetical protein
MDRDERQAPVQEEHLDQRSCAGIAPPATRPLPERLVRCREHAPLAGLRRGKGTGHGTRLARQDLEVVVEHQGLGAPDGAPLVADDDRSCVGDLDRGAPDARGERHPGEPCRHRVEGLADADPGPGVDLDRDDAREVEGLRGQRPQGRPVGLAVLADRCPARPDVAGKVAPVGLFQLPVELGETLHVRDRHEEPAALPADLALDTALLVGTALARDAEEGVERVVGAQGDEPLGLVPVASPQDPGDQGPGVVVPDADGHAAQAREGDHVALEEGLLALAAEGDVDRGPRVAQAQLEHRHLGALAGDVHVGEAEVDLGLVARCMQRDDRDGDAVEAELTAEPHDRPPDGRLGEGRTLLVDQALPDPARRVALLAGRLLVLGQPAADDRRVGTQGRLGPFIRLARRRDGRGKGLADHAPVHGMAARQLADRHPFLPVLPADTLELLHPRHLL